MSSQTAENPSETNPMAPDDGPSEPPKLEAAADDDPNLYITARERRMMEASIP